MELSQVHGYRQSQHGSGFLILDGAGPLGRDSFENNEGAMLIAVTM